MSIFRSGSSENVGSDQLPADVWIARGFTTAERERWLSAGLGFGDAATATSCISVGLSPADLRLKVDGRRVAIRLREGESAGVMAHMLKMQQHQDLLHRLGGQATTIIPTIDGQPESDVDRLISGLEVVLSGHLSHPICICCDDLAIRAFVDGNGAEFRVAVVDLSRGAPTLSLFVCACHPLSISEPQPLAASPFPASTTACLVRCPQALLSGLRSVLESAGEDNPAARVWVDRESIRGKARDAMVLAGVPLRSSDHYSRMNREFAMAKPMLWLDEPPQSLSGGSDVAFASDLPRLTARSASGTGALPAWSGMPTPPACRAITHAFLAALDDAISLPRTELADLAANSHCQDHPQADVTAFFENNQWLVESGPGRERLTLAGQRHADELAMHSAPFRFSGSLRRHNVIHSWQGEALVSWASHGRFGVVEAVTGTGKTRVGIEAAGEALADGLKVVVCVPTLVLQEQWHRVITDAGLRRVGRVGGGSHDTFLKNDVLIGTVQTLRNSKKLLTGTDQGYMLIVDECHRVGAPTFQSALDTRYIRRLGLTATFERSDSRLKDLEAFFQGSPVFHIDYERAVREGIVAHYVVARVGVDFTDEEQDLYVEADATCRESRGRLLRAGLPAEPFGDFMEAVAALAQADSGPLAGEAKRYLDAFSRRALVLSLAQGKVDAVRVLAPVIATASGCLLFTMRVAGAEQAAALLREQGVPVVAIHGGSTGDEREEALSLLRTGGLAAVAAPRILDEGVDVPDADLGVVIATSSRRLQMIQRMGRVLRLKKDGRRARFVLLYVRGTAEDPHGEGGAHEAFFDAITPWADEVADFDPAQAGDLCDFLRRAQVAPGSNLK
jgi:superfamily II DNA or RNA helicase